MIINPDSWHQWWGVGGPGGSEPCPPSANMTGATRRRSQLRNSVSGQIHRHGHGIVTAYRSPEPLVQLGVIHLRTHRACGQPGSGMQPATMAGATCIQIAQRTARMYWGHLPYGALRGDENPVLSSGETSAPKGEPHRDWETTQRPRTLRRTIRRGSLIDPLVPGPSSISRV